MTLLAQDTFTRANQSGWGTASDGEVWARKSGTAAWDITSNRGQQDTTAGTNSYQLGTATPADAEALVRVSASSTADSIAVTLRVQGTTTYYFANMVGTTFAIKKDVAATVTQLASATVTFTANPDFYWIRFRVVGTSLTAKIWKDGTTEPSGWTVTVIDSTLTGAGGYGLRALTNTAGDIITFDSYQVTDLSTKSTGVRTLVRTQITQSAGLRALVMTQKTVSAGLRALVRSRHSLSSVLRTPVRTQVTKSAGLRTVVRGISRVVVLRIIVRGRTQGVSLRVLARTQIIRSAGLRAPVKSQHTPSAQIRLVVVSPVGITPYVTIVTFRDGIAVVGGR